METLDIALNNNQVNLLNHTDVNIDQLLGELFQPATDNYQKLAYELQREFKWGGSPDVTSMVFDRIKYDTTTHKGSFRIVLDISFTFGCEDVRTYKPDQTSEWTFTIHLTEKIMKLYSSPFAESRSTADEF
ncbi:hypothetical protein [Mucilaginibacter sp. dw_454]|uniref:hypothetical protein n=1 Tax=Mucilaginibacter sp. dw_454 TaxID=2720079 RepID=UPI001BD218C9|nr:hypothetical protein [Mucilaginibacter sp. dw_454]